MLLLRPNIYKQNRETIWIIAENKNIQALMTKQFIWSSSPSLLWLSNNNIITQKEYMFFQMWNYDENCR
jgi:hypothetical protein